MEFAALKRTFERDGYVVIEDMFDPATMDRLECSIAEHFGDRPEFLHDGQFITKAKTEVIPWFPQREGVTDFDDIERDGRLHELSSLVLGEQWESQYCMVMFSRAGSSGQAWHQDCDPSNPERYNLNRLVYTRDIVDEMGGQPVVVPGSHRRGLLEAGDPMAAFEGQVVLRPRKGSLLLLHGHSWHRVLPVVHGHSRSSTNFRAAPKGTPQDITDVCVYRNMRYRFSTEEVVEERIS
ncbi:MAG: phytanoyl-CoA dioxygenase family protein [Pseudomonadota bacterium]